MSEPVSRLDSWKEIARYLGRDLRTVIRWEQERGLPVHRVPGVKRSGVFAYREELDAWLAQHPAASVNPSETETAATPATRRLWLWAGASALALAGIVVVATLISEAGARPVESVAVEGTELRALDGEGRTVWVHRFEAAHVEPGSGRWMHIGDLDADGRAEIVAVVKVRRTSTSEIVDQMLSFSEDGQLRWTHTPDARLRFGDGEYGPPWASEDLLAFDSGGERRLAWAIRHYTWWPSMLVVLDAQGAERGRFVNSGWIRSLGVSQDGRVLLASGISNAHRATFIALLEAARVTGRSPEPPGSDYACLDCGPDRPIQYFVLPRTDVSEHFTFPPLYAPAIQSFSDGAAQVRVSEGGQSDPPETIYEFSPAYALQRARFSDSFWEWHRRLEAEGLLPHDERACPMRGFRDVQRWTPRDGWRTIRVPSH